jgi:hypothetical protein
MTSFCLGASMYPVGHLYILVITYYFSKWAEVTTLKEVKKKKR